MPGKPQIDIAAEESGKLLSMQPILRDAHAGPRPARWGDQGDARSTPARSAFYLPRTKLFPKNTEIDYPDLVQRQLPRPASPGRRRPRAVMLREHHSLVQLPDGNLEPAPSILGPISDHPLYGFRRLDDEPMVKRFILRHRLAKIPPK